MNMVMESCGKPTIDVYSNKKTQMTKCDRTGSDLNTSDVISCLRSGSILSLLQVEHSFLEGYYKIMMVSQA